MNLSKKDFLPGRIVKYRGKGGESQTKSVHQLIIPQRDLDTKTFRIIREKHPSKKSVE